ncbi:MAG: hypothetical protein ACI4L9_05165 [Candidatus Coproplasma sp.]
MKTRRKIEKKVTKKFAMEIAAQFFGRTVQPKEQDNGFVFTEGLIRFEVFPYYQSVSKSVLSKEYPYGQVFINAECCYGYFYINDKIIASDEAPFISA